MSELIQARCATIPLRRSLFLTASILGLLGHLTLDADALAATDEDNPTVWIELGGQLERVDGGPAVFSPPFFAQASSSDLATMTEAQRSPRYAIGGEGKVSFTPKDSDWVISAGVKYGRSNKDQHSHSQTLYHAPHTTVYIVGVLTPLKLNFSKQIFGDDQTESSASHSVLDFQAGKDVGLGLFGSGAKSVVSAGVRYAQFSASTDTALHARPVLAYDFVTVPGKYRWFNYAHHTYTAVLHAQSSTHAIGPSVSWDASVPIAGRESEMTLTFDWGANAAVLFGRQRARVSHETKGYLMSATGGLQRLLYSIPPHIQHYTHSTVHNHSRSVAIPNVGGFAGLSFRYADAKVSLGYRADFFFGAMDNGIDSRQTADQKFYGPFATMSIGLGG